jgi:uncharacterized protein (DUF433 family)
MNAKRTIVIGGLAAALIGGGAAVAASGGDGGKTEDAILADAAKRLGVTPGQLERALANAEDAQLDQAVEDGRLTQEEADALKKHRRESGRVLGFPGSGPGGHVGGPGLGGHGPGFGGPGDAMQAVAKELGISVSDLFGELRDGKTLAEIAKEHDKSLADLKAAAREATEKNIDEAVEDGRLTEQQADRLREHIPDIVDRLGEGPPGGRGGFGPPPGSGPPTGDRPAVPPIW